MKLSELPEAHQITILKALVEQMYLRNRDLWVQIEFDNGLQPNELLTPQDRLLNRLSVDLALSDNGIPAHDDAALEWVTMALKGTTR